jgi:hypothetical protein
LVWGIAWSSEFPVPLPPFESIDSEDKHNAQDHCYCCRARLSHLGEPAGVRDTGSQRHRQEQKKKSAKAKKKTAELGTTDLSAKKKKSAKAKKNTEILYRIAA